MSQVRYSLDIDAHALIALGGNAMSPWGDPTATVLRAISILTKRIGPDVVQSPLYVTPAFPAGTGPNFINAVIRIATPLTATEILPVLHDIEAMADRRRDLRWGQRTLDLDLIGLGTDIFPDVDTYKYWLGLDASKQAEIAPDQLILPHPRVQDRSFVLVPLADVAPDWMHPVLGQTARQMRDARPASEVKSVVRL
jgi:2-amino-4-hydroxy-6-hydroxymethyldihydropteridine diphosphokinase